MRKRLLAILMACTMVCGLAACGGSGKNTDEGKSTENNNTGNAGFTTESDWKPSTTISVVVPANAGGGTDLTARVFCQYAKEMTGCDFIVVNASGAAGSVAANQVKSANADGCTVLFGHNLVNVANVAKVTDYDYTAFTAGPNFAKDPAQQLYVNAEKYADLDAFIAAAKAAPGTLAVATEVGAYTYYEVLALQKAAGIELKVVDAGSNSDKITAMLSGSVDLMPGSFVNCADYVTSGKFTCIGAPLEEESELLPGVKTFKEQGIDLVYPDCDYSFYFPAGTPENVITWFNDLTEQMTAREDVAKQLAELYVSPYFLNSEDAAANDAAYLATFKELAASAQ